jgi:hypothetical protein
VPNPSLSFFCFFLFLFCFFLFFFILNILSLTRVEICIWCWVLSCKWSLCSSHVFRPSVCSFISERDIWRYWHHVQLSLQCQKLVCCETCWQNRKQRLLALSCPFAWNNSAPSGQFHQIQYLSICRKAVNYKVATKCKYQWKRCLKWFPVWRICTAATCIHRQCRIVEKTLGDLLLCGRDLILVKAMCL